MPRIRPVFRLLGCLTLAAVAACVQPGSLDNKEEFQSLLAGDAMVGMGGSSAGSSGSGAPGGSGGSGSPAVDGGGPETGCAAACDLIAMRCATAGCHTGATAAGGLDLNVEDFAMHLGGMPATTAACAGETLIDTANPENSALYGKLLDPPSCGIRMPLGLPLEETEIACIGRWLAEGAQCGGAAPGTDAGPTDAGGGNVDAGTDAAGPDPSATSLWIEAEDTGTLTAPLASATDADASGGEFLAVPTSTMLAINAMPATDGVASYIFNVGAAGTYRLWGRVRVATTDNDSFWVRIDGGAWYQWNNIPVGTEWHWDDVHDTAATPPDTVVDFELTAGQHTLNIAYREIGAELDKILITDDTALVPTGEGQ